jgi:peptide/nickel transport system permease protein
MRILFKEILPNLIPAMVTVAATGLGILIAAEGALAFLGLGLETSWGFMINANRNRLEKAWWATIFPCIMLFLTVLSFNLIGDRLARRFDVREAAV